MLIHHTDCGMQTFRDDDFRKQIHQDTGIKPEWAAESFDNLEEDVRQSIARIKASPFNPSERSDSRLRLRGRDRAAARGGLDLTNQRAAVIQRAESCRHDQPLRPARRSTSRALRLLARCLRRHERARSLSSLDKPTSGRLRSYAR